MADTKNLVQFHKTGDETDLLFGKTVAEGVEFSDGEDLQTKLPSLLNKIEVIKIGTSALVIGSDKSVTIPDFYNKTDSDAKYATKDEVSALPKFGVLVVEELPGSDIKSDKIYLLKEEDEAENNLYTEYIYVNKQWEKLGTQKIDISGKQDKLNATQLAAVNSGITAAKVSTYDGYATGKQNTLTSAQLAAANSGITTEKVTKYDGYEATINGKQNKLSSAQQAAADSGITAAKVTAYDGYAKDIASCVSYTEIKTLS